MADSFFAIPGIELSNAPGGLKNSGPAQIGALLSSMVNFRILKNNVKYFDLK